MDPFEAFESGMNSNDQFGEDPAAEFLAREQAEFAKIEGLNNEFSQGINLNHDFGKFIFEILFLNRIFKVFS